MTRYTCRIDLPSFFLVRSIILDVLFSTFINTYRTSVTLTGFPSSPKHNYRLLQFPKGRWFVVRLWNWVNEEFLRDTSSMIIICEVEKKKKLSLPLIPWLVHSLNGFQCIDYLPLRVNLTILLQSKCSGNYDLLFPLTATRRLLRGRETNEGPVESPQDNNLWRRVSINLLPSFVFSRQTETPRWMVRSFISQ